MDTIYSNKTVSVTELKRNFAEIIQTAIAVCATDSAVKADTNKFQPRKRVIFCTEEAQP